MRATWDLEALFDGDAVVGLADAELLARFARGPGPRGERAFGALVERHGPMVRGTCRRVLGDPADADDAFQATFLVLARRAGSVRVDDSLGRWLHGVARRVATRARSDRDRRRRREAGSLDADRAAADHVDPDRAELLAMLDAEVARLPEPFRSAVVLCDLGGRTHEQAALELGCPAGTVKSRLARGRDRLRARLTRLGFAGQALGAPLPPPPGLVAAATRSAAGLVGPGPKAGLGAGIGWTLFTEGNRRMLTWIPAKWLAIATLGLGTGATGWFYLAQSLPGGPPPAPRPAADPGAAPDHIPRESSRVSMPDYVVEPPDIIAVEVQGDLEGRPITGERLVRPDGKISLGYYGEVYVAGLTLGEIKEKLIQHLRKHLTEKQLGLVGDPSPDGKVDVRDAAESRRVFVDVVTYNSKVYYVQGDVKNPGRLPITGNETVLDAIHFAGGLTFADPGRAVVRLVRPAPPGARGERTLPVDLNAIERGDAATNYQLFPRDRIVVHRDPPLTDAEQAAGRLQEQVQRQQERLDRVEQKLDLILQKLDALPKP